MTEEIDPSMGETNEDSGVIKALRQQIKDLKADLDARPAREDLEVQVRNQLKREQDAAALLIERGQPQGLAEFMLTKIGDAEITAEAVSTFLQGLGIDTEPVSSDEPEAVSQHQQLAETVALASRVSAAASGASADEMTARIAQAQSMQELEAIMDEIGAVQS